MRLNHSRLAAAANPTNPFCLFTGKFFKAFFLLPAICWLLAAQGLQAQTTWYVNAAASSGGNGTSWANAYQSLQLALTAASSGHEIWVAEGTYSNGSFVMKNGVEILGGFPNTGNPGLGDRDWMAHVTTLSGGTNVIHNNFTVGSPLTGTAVLDGFTITGGAGGANGGGMFNQYASPTVKNCVFSENSALQGAGMYNLFASPTVTNCIFSENICDGPGLQYGAGMANEFSSPTVTNCLFSNNVAGISGSGMHNGENSDPLVLNCTFSGNTSNIGSAIYNRYANSNPTIKNCIIWGNDGGIINNGASSTVTYSIVQGGFAGTGNLNVDPLFVSSTDFHLQACSPAIDAGTDAGAPGDDLDGNARPFDAAPNVAGNYDMGAYEYQQALPAPTATCQNITVQLDANGSVTVPAADINDGSTGGCGALSYEIDGQASRTFNCADIGVNTVTLTVTDAFNNTDDCSATITVADDDNPLPVVTAPTVTQPTCALPTGTIFVNASGGGTLEYSVNDGADWQLSENFPGLTPGNYHIKVRLEANPTCETTYASNPVELVSPFTASTTTDTWTGCVSTDWHTAGNWADGSVPTAADDVKIPNVTNDPIIGAAAVAQSVHVQTSGALTINAGASLTVNGSFSDAGATQALKNDGTLDNSGILIIGSTTPSGQNGLVNTGVFNNNTDGEMTASRASTRGIFNSGTFTNYAKITLGVGSGVGPTGVFNTAGTFSNSGCTALFRVNTNAVITTSGGTFTNSGSIIENATGNSIISTNSGFVQNLNGGSFFIGSGNSSLNAPGVVWTGCTSTDWYTASNWMLGVVPTSSSDVKIAKLANDPIIDAAVLAKTVHVLQGATLTINATKSLTLDGSFSYQGSQAMQNNGTVNNNGVITIGATTSSGHSGLSNYGPFALFNNNAGAEIVIDRATSQGIFNQRTFNNSGKITIGASNSTGFRGLENQQNFNNNAGGEITIDNSTEFGLANFALTFNNSGKITIGAASVSVGINGIRNTSFTNFNNNPGGEIKIDNSTSAGIYNQGGTFTNAAKITIGAVANVGDYGLRNTGTFSNNTGGEIAIDRSTLNGLYNQTGTITNAAEITIGALASVGTNGVQNLSGSTFTNSGCTALLNIVANAVLSNDGTFTNSGRIIENATGNSSITTNSGTVQNLNGGTFSITTNTGGLTTATGDIWTGCLSTDWHTDGNWFDGSVPTAADNAVVPDAINDPVIGAGAVANSVNVEAGGSLTVEATGSLPINSPASPLFTNSGTVVNEGTISLNTSVSFKFHRLLNLETGTFTNNNVLQLGNSGSQTIRGIYNRGSFVNATGGSISIAKCNGGIFQDAGSFVNNANIVFSSVTADSTAIVLFGGTFSNTPCSATILDQPGSNLNRFSAAGGTFTNDGLLTENSSGSSSITNNTGIVQNLGGGSFNITNNTGVLTTNPGQQTACCPPADIFYVNAAATGANNGSSWADAFTDLQNALNSPCTGITQIWVAEGTYKPTSGTDRSISFVMKNGVEILGGFPNTGDPGFGDRNPNPATNGTVLSGDINTAGTDSDNSYSVVMGSGTNNTAVLDGFTVTLGNADGPGGFLDPQQCGGGMYNNAGSPTVRNCAFTDNNAAFSGGGMYNLFSSTPTVVNCSFTNNSGGEGGGMSNISESSPNVTNCIFTENTTPGNGGGMYNFNLSAPVLTNCTFSNNTAANGGGVCNLLNASPTLTNCILWGNNSQIYNGGGASPSVTYCDVQGGYAGAGNINADPLFVDAPNGDLRLQACSPAIDAANDADAPANDLDGNARFDALAGGSIADMGAYEYQDEATPTVAACQTSVDAVLDNTGQATVLATALNNGSTGCSPLVFYIDGQSSITFDCSQIGSQSVTLTATYVNRTSTCATTVHVLDNTVPTITCPDNIAKTTDTDQCSAMTTYSVMASDNCAYTLTRTSPAGTASGSAFPIGTTNVEWSVTDAGGNATSCAFTVTVTDEQDPTITCPANIAKNTDAGQCSAVTTYTVTASDNCAYTLTRTSPAGTASGSAFPIGTTDVEWSVTDAGGNATSCAFTVTVTDGELPGITCPDAVTVTCSGNVPAVNIAAVTATDNCGSPVKSHVGDATSNMTCTNRKTITRTYRATDGSGNSVTCSQVITVFDNVKPNFTSVPANVTVQCNSVPAVGTATASDGCGGAVTVVYNGQTIANGTCTDAYTVTRQWTATDGCGNTKTATQRISVVDTQKPNFTSTPANITVQCSAIPAPTTPAATDNCDASVAVTYNGQTQTNGACANAYTLTRIWTAADNCGNTRSISQRITVVDNGKPVFTAFPTNLSIACDENPPAVGSPTASDGCGSATVTYLGQTTTSGNCPGNYQIKRTWRATDACGNSTAATQTIQVSDSGAPVFTSTPGPLTIECGDPIPPLVNPTATDACGGYVAITFLGNVPSGSGCTADYTITRTWRAEDLCGNSTTTSQMITVLGNNGYGEEGAGNRAEGAMRLTAHRSSLIANPNPTTDRIWLDLSGFANEAVTVSIVSDLGQLIWENRIPAVEELKLQISLHEAGAMLGIYTVSVRSASRVAAARVVLVE
ncbi:MAG: HYR domain-containing protein [Saprospiraceae bacterium]